MKCARAIAIVIGIGGTLPSIVFGQVPNNPRVVAYTGETAPGAYGSSSSVGTFTGLGTQASIAYGTSLAPNLGIAIDDNGGVMFTANAFDGTTNVGGMWLEYPNPGNLYSIYTDDSTTLSTLGALANPFLSRNGTVTAVFQDVSNGAPYEIRSTTSTLGWQTMGTDNNTEYSWGGGLQFQDFLSPSGNALGSTTYVNIDSTQNIREVSRGGSIAALATTGQLVSASGGSGSPNLPTGTYYGTQTSQGAINGASNVAFISDLTGGVTGSGIFKEVSSGSTHSLQDIAYTGMAAPGVSGGVFDAMGGAFSTSQSNDFNVFMPQGFNDAGQLAFRASLQHTGSVSSSNDQGVWTDASGSLALVARSGDVAPGAWNTSSATFTGFDTPLVNHNGRIDFYASLSSGGGGIFSLGPTSGATLQPIAVTGQSIPGTSATLSGFLNDFTGANSGLFSKHYQTAVAAMNGVGQSMVFYATLSNGGQAIMTVDPYGNLLPAVLTGIDSIQTDSSHAASIITGLTFSHGQVSGGEDGYSSVLNVNGQFPYTANLQDGRTVIAVGHVVLAGDANGDGIVNGLDISMIASHWLQTVVPGTNGDVNFDGTVNGLDISKVSSTWNHSLYGAPGAVVAPVPEPSTCVLAIIAIVAALAVRLRRPRGQLT